MDDQLSLWFPPTEVKRPQFLPSLLIDRLRSEADAISLCWHKRRVKYTVRHAASLLGIPASHLSNIVNGKKYLRGEIRVKFQFLCGNFAIRQWEDKYAQLHTVVESEEERLRRENAEMKAELQRRAA